ncbi:MAG: DUF1343 domain-containing protein [Bacteroidetes bacterium]|nr:DUF1343 domain-containing protein [Bacteroidota bacterium]
MIRAVNFSTRISMVLFLFLYSATSDAQNKSKITTGAEQIDILLPLIKDKRVALLVNNTSVIGKTHLVDSLIRLKINISKIFSPEHGFRGNTPDGAEINDSIDSATKLPIVSLYGKNRKARPEQLADVDVVIFDIQDVGVRYYTYIGSMHYMMEACAENGKKLIVLDRPNPNASYIDGPVLDIELKSFVGMHPIPTVYGLTMGELAIMINGEGWLTGGEKCDLQVIQLKNYDHKKKYSLRIKPSPNLPNDHAVAMYPSICLFEGTVMSLGRGTNTPFEILGHPLLKNYSFKFKPESIAGMSKNPPQENKVCYGVDLRKEKVNDELSLKYLIKFYHEFPDQEKEKFFTNYFNTLAGNKILKEQIRKGTSENEIKETWQKDLKSFKEKRKKYLLYP